MNNILRSQCACIVIVLFCSVVGAQSTNPLQSSVVPQLVKFSGKAVDEQGHLVSGTVGLTFAIYSALQGGPPLWMETQNVTADVKGNYTVQLGAASAQGLPLNLFSAGEARWVGVRVTGGEEQPRILLLSVPYALKAADAQTLGGLPSSAFVLAAPPNSGSSSASPSNGDSGANPPSSGVTGSGTADYVPLWTSGSNIGNSVLYQSGTGSKAKIGINTTKPASALDVKGGSTIRGLFSLPATGTSTATQGYNSQPTELTASSYNSATGAAVSQNFLWQAEPTGNNTNNTSATLNLLFGAGGNKLAETGLNIASNGQITFANGQTFPGTVTSVGSGAGLTGGPITGSGTLSIASGGVTNTMLQNSSLTVTAGTDLTGGGAVALGGSTTLNVDTTKVPQLGTANTFTGNQTVNGSISAGPISATTTSTAVAAVTGTDASGSGSNSGVYGISTDGVGVAGNSANAYGTYSTGGSVGAFALSTNGYGVLGESDNGAGVTGQSESSYGVWGDSQSSYGVFGNSTNSEGVFGQGTIGVGGSANSGGSYGVYGNGPTGVYGTGSTYGVLGESSSSSGSGGGFSNSTTGDALFTYNQSGGFAAFFDGNVDVDGKLSKAGGSFKIDHPLDPANKYLYHSFVESPDMKNIYDGVATLDGNGEAVIQMPDWFGVLNRDFRYQLTCIGGFAPVYIAEELANNQFKIGGGRAGMRVSWQITGIRQDAWANANRIPVEEEKEAKLKGFYLHPQLYGAPAEKGISWGRHPEMMKKLLQDQEQMKEKQAGLTESPMMARPTRPIPPPILKKPVPPIPPAALPHLVTKEAER
jgi:hypothetical protein